MIIQDYEYVYQSEIPLQTREDESVECPEAPCDVPSDLGLAQNVPTTSGISNTSAEPEQMSTSFHEILPIPTVSKTPTPTGKTSRAEKSHIITSSPYKKTLKEHEKNKRLPLREKGNSKSKPIPANPTRQSDDCECFACGEEYGNSRSGESWLQCSKCQAWGHELCTSYAGFGVFVCDICARAW